MPVVLRIGPYVFFFYSEEGNEPAHIHVRRNRALAKFWLRPVKIVYGFGFADYELRRIHRLVEEHQALLQEGWDEHFRRARG